jgi:predicted permease
MFGVVSLLFFRLPPGIASADGLVRLYFKAPASGTTAFAAAGTDYPTLAALRDRVAGFSQTAGVWTSEENIGRGNDAGRANVALASYELFPMLRLRAALGRFYGIAEDRRGGEHVAVVSHDYWQRDLGGDSNVVGRALIIGDAVYTIVGVGPEKFGGINMEPADIFVPLAVAGDEIVGKGAIDPVDGRGLSWLSVVARLRPDTPPRLAATQATLVFRANNSTTRYHDTLSQVMLNPLQEARGPTTSSAARIMTWLAALGVIVLLIACANIANLVQIRGLSAGRDYAIRASLGATRLATMRPLLIESFAIAIAGCAAGLAIVAVAGPVARAYLLPDLPQSVPLFDGRVLAGAAMTLILTMFVIGVIPALQITRGTILLRLGAGRHGSSRRDSRTRFGLMVFQTSLSLTLLVGAGLFVRSLNRVQAIDIGIDADRVVNVTIDLPKSTTVQEANALYYRLLDRVNRLQGVEAAALSMGSPFGRSYASRVRIEGHDTLPRFRSGGPYFQAIGQDYIKTMGMRVLSGRPFGSYDIAGAPNVVIVGATFAKALWPDESPIGKCLYLADTVETCRRIVGVVTDVKRNRILEPETLFYYVPLAQFDKASVDALMVRAGHDPAGLVRAISVAAHSLDNMPVATIQTIGDKIAPQLRSWRLGARAFTVFALLALLIAAIGIATVLSYSVSQRTKEIGIRIALGGQAHQIVWLVVAQGARMTSIGVLIGALGGYGLGRAIASLLYRVSPADPIVISATSAILFIVALAAAYLPARRAAAVDPSVTLRID